MTAGCHDRPAPAADSPDVATLALEDGSWHQGWSAGAPGRSGGELVFNTGLTGYQEILTDPSYAGQIVTMTASEIGNYGVAADDVESAAPRVAGFVVREMSPVASNWRAAGSLPDYLREHGIVAIAGVDTRAITRKLRSSGVMRAVIGTGPCAPEDLVAEARLVPPMEGADLATRVTAQAPYSWPPVGDGEPSARELDAASGEPGRDAVPAPAPAGFELPASVRPARGSTGAPRFVVAWDFGLKWNILRRLAVHGCRLRVVPATTPADEVLALRPDGVFLSNGPGDPAALGHAVANVRQVLDAGVPVFGICLGHQILALASGARTYKLKFGHRGTNHPVRHLETGAIEITSQNHGFAVDPGSLPLGAELTHVSLYDGTVEGFRLRDRPAFCVQYHPEASPGPHDADYLFGRFMELMDRHARR